MNLNLIEASLMGVTLITAAIASLWFFTKNEVADLPENSASITNITAKTSMASNPSLPAQSPSQFAAANKQFPEPTNSESDVRVVAILSATDAVNIKAVIESDNETRVFSVNDEIDSLGKIVDIQPDHLLIEHEQGIWKLVNRGKSLGYSKSNQSKPNPVSYSQSRQDSELQVEGLTPEERQFQQRGKSKT